MLDSALRLALRNFSTLFLLVAILVLPIHVAYGLVFRDVVALYDVADEIQSAPVRGVTSADLRTARLVFWGVNALELLLIPLAARATRRVMEVDESGDVPGVWDALRTAFRGTTRGLQGLGGGRAKELLAALLAALAAGLLVERMGLLLAGFTPPDSRFAVVALVQTAARATGAPLLLVPLVCASRPAEARPQE